MNEYDLNNFDMMFIGKRSEYFQPIKYEETITFKEKGLLIGVSEIFSALEITRVAINIGSGVIAGLGVIYIAKIFDKIFSAKQKAKADDIELEISVTISERISIQNVQNITEIEKAMEIVIFKNEK